MSGVKEASTCPDGYRELSTEELRELLQDDCKMEHIIQLNEKFQELQVDRESLLTSNRSLAEVSLAQRPRLHTGKARLADKYRELSDLTTACWDKQSQLGALVFGADKNQTKHQSPVLQSVQSPVLQSVQSPVLQSVQSPVLKSVQSPVLKSVHSPVLQSVQSPVLKSVQSPVLKSVQSPVLKSVQSSRSSVSSSTPPLPPRTQFFTQAPVDLSYENLADEAGYEAPDEDGDDGYEEDYRRSLPEYLQLEDGPEPGADQAEEEPNSDYDDITAEEKEEEEDPDYDDVA